MSDDSVLTVSLTVGDATFEARGSADVVMLALAEFREMSAGPPRRTRKEVPDDPGEKAEKDPPAARASGASAVPLPQFLASDAIRGNAKIATAVVTWSADHDGKESLSISEIKERWRRTNVKVPGNINRDVESAVKQGWLHKDAKGYTVTGFGRTAIGVT